MNSEEDVVLAVQDTTYLDFTHCLKTEGLGKLFRSDKNPNPLVGLVLHNTLAITEKGECLGLLDQKIYRRKDEDIKHTNKIRPIEEKESYRWLQSAKQISSHCQSAKIVYVCDREGDIFEFFSEVIHQTPHFFLVRASSDRVLGHRSTGRGSDYETICLWEYMNLQEISGELQVEIPAQRNRPAKIVPCNLRFAPVSVDPTYRRPAARSKVIDPLPVQLYAIWVKENSTQPNKEALEWMLLTNYPILSFKDALQKMEWYRARWHIENYHKVLKSGCNIEKSKLNHADKLEKFSALMSVIAARVYQMKLSCRSHPTAPCSDIFGDEEWKILYQFIHKTKDLPDRVPTTKEAVMWIAKLGGFLGRKRDGNPGSIVIWRGWQRFTDILESWKVFQLSATSG